MGHDFTVVGDPGATDAPVFLKGHQSTWGGSDGRRLTVGVRRAHHQSQGAGVDVGVVHAAVDFICTVPVRRTLVLVTEPPRLRSVTAEEDRERKDT